MLKKNKPLSPSLEQKAFIQPDEAVGTVLARDQYVRERHIFLLRTIFSLAAALIVAMIAVIVLASRPSQNHFFLSDNEGRIRPITALNKPVNSINEVGYWLTNAVVQAYTFSFANYKQELSIARESFTPEGWKGFEAALRDSGNLKSVIDNKYVSTAVPVGAPVLLEQGIIDGRYAYRFQFPIQVTYQSAVSQAVQKLMITVTVVRQPESTSPRGLGIAQVIAES